MKRNINLIELSRDHHHGLLLGWKIKQGIKNNATENQIIKYIKHFAKLALMPHFKQEEEDVLKFLPANDVFKIKVVEEHQELLNLVAQLSENSNIEDLMAVADKLEQHIRFEERTLFPYLEKTLLTDDLKIIGAAISKHHHPYVEDYENDFWK